MSQMYSIDQYRFNPMNPMLLRAGSANSLSNKRHKRMAWQASVASYDAKFDRCRLWQKLSLEKTLHQYAAMLVWNTARRKQACEQVQKKIHECWLWGSKTWTMATATDRAPLTSNQTPAEYLAAIMINLWNMRPYNAIHSIHAAKLLHSCFQGS